VTPARRERVAVVGSGISGLAAAYVLQRCYDVTLYEAAGRLGGHTDTHEVVTPDAGMVPVDSGFIVHNERTYPLLCRLFSELHVATRPTEMSMSIRCEGCGLEYAGAKGLGGLFAQPRSLANPAFFHLLAQVRRFHGQARGVVVQGDEETSLGEFLARGRYSSYFCSHFVVPLVACVWSVAADTALRYPARTLFTFLDNHGMLSFAGSPTWRTIVGGSRTYVDRVVKGLTAVATSTPVRAVVAQAAGVEVRTDDDHGVFYDRAVMATHADEALSLLANPTPLQRSLLGAFTYSRNETVLHTDATLLPTKRRARAAWNFVMTSCVGPADHVLVSYDMNLLQGVPSTRPHIVSLNSTDRVDPGRVLARMMYEHPIFDATSVAAQRDLPKLNDNRLAFAGAYHGWGFHEDGCRSGILAAKSLGVTW
jgi:predicted NAD/FAD-binding protein